MNTQEYYLNVKRHADSIWNKSIEPENLELTTTTHNMVIELGDWLSILEHRPEIKILNTAIKELQLSIATLSLGFYSKAFTGLRYFLERSLVAVLFSAQEMQLRLWEQGERDTYWSEIMDEDKGLFSLSFSSAFFKELKDELIHFKTLTKKVYRECSEFVHGNNSIINSLPNNLLFNDSLFKMWHQKALIIIRIVFFVLNLRFLKFLSADELKKTENINLEYFNGISVIRGMY